MFILNFYLIYKSVTNNSANKGQTSAIWVNLEIMRRHETKSTIQKKLFKKPPYNYILITFNYKFYKFKPSQKTIKEIIFTIGMHVNILFAIIVWSLGYWFFNSMLKENCFCSYTELFCFKYGTFITKYQRIYVYCHDITEILLKVSLNTITPPSPPIFMFCLDFQHRNDIEVQEKSLQY
jgi:hypothetical protein